MRKICALLIAVLLLAACGADDAPSSSSAPPAPPESTPSASQPEPEPERRSVLTGQPADVPAGQRLAAVVVGNYAGARPQSGLSQAGVVVEEVCEGGITRLLAFYEDYPAMPEVGPVRSSRDGLLQLAMPWQPLYVCYGGSQMHDWYLEAFQLEERTVDALLGHDITFADEGRIAGASAENTTYTSGEKLAKAVAAAGLDDARDYGSLFFDFVPTENAPRALAGGAGEAVSIPFSESYITYFGYDAGRYAMSQHNSVLGRREATVDHNTGGQLYFDNLLVLFAEMPAHEGVTVDIPNVQYGYGGVGYYFCGGAFERVRWMKDSPQHVLRIMAADGSEAPVQLNPGTSYVAFVDVEKAVQVSFGAAGGEMDLGECMAKGEG